MTRVDNLKFKFSKLISTVWPIVMVSFTPGTLSLVFAVFIGFFN